MTQPTGKQQPTANGADAQAARLEMNLDPQGMPGLRQWSGYVFEEFLPDLQGYRGRQVFREMADNDPVIGGFMFAVEMLVRRVPWRIEPGDDSPQAHEDADFVDSCIHDMEITWADTLSEILTFLPFGFGVHEMLFKRRLGPDQEDPRLFSKFNDGRIGWRLFAGRAQETLLHWTFDDEGRATQFVQLPPPDYVQRTVDLSRCLHFRTTARKSNPEGRSVIRNSWLPWYRKNNIERIEAIGIERDLAGLPVAWVPPEWLAANKSAADSAMYAQMLKIVTNIRRDEQEGLVMPLMYDKDGNKTVDLTLLSTGGARQFDTDKIVGRYDQRIAMPMIADWILLGHENVGSNALSNDKTDIWLDAISGWLDCISAPINARAIPALMRFNGRPLDVLPKLVHGDIASTDLNMLGNYVLHLAQAGAPMFPNEDLMSYLLRQANLPAAAAGTAGAEL